MQQKLRIEFDDPSLLVSFFGDLHTHTRLGFRHKHQQQQQQNIPVPGYCLTKCSLSALLNYLLVFLLLPVEDIKILLSSLIT